jgi:MFS transporter, FHS family, Na+ dependent glucose transporter 1
MSKTILYSIAFTALGLVVGSLGPTLPALAANTQVEMKQISHLFIARSLGTMLGSWMIGRWYDKVAGHPLMAASLLSAAITLALMPSATILWTLLALSALIGISTASVNVGGHALIVLVHGERVRPFMSVMHFAFGVGGLFSPLLVAQFIHRADGLQITYLTLGLLTLPAVALTLLSRSPSLRSHGNTGTSAPLQGSVILLFAIFFFLEIGAEAGIMGWYFSFAVESGVNLRAAAHMNSAFWAAFTLGRLATIWLTTRFNVVSMVIMSLGLAVTIALVMLIIPTTPVILWMGAIGLGLSVAPVFPNIYGYAQRVLGLSGKVSGWFLIGSSAGSMFWPWLIGQFFKATGPQVLMWVVLNNMCGAIAIIILLLQRESRSARRMKDEGRRMKDEG